VRQGADELNTKLGAERVYPFAFDVRSRPDVEALVSSTMERFGAVDVLINNAGLAVPETVTKITDEGWDTVLNTNLRGAFAFTKAFSRHLLGQRSGRIINVASVIGLMGNAGQSNDAASKAGLIGFTKSIAREFASRGITVNALAPGFIETDMTAVLNEQTKTAILGNIPMKALGKVDDIAAAALLSPAGSSGVTLSFLARS
jgi:3-oxoacyl-[acyl-carrier protein] reductase